MTRRLEHAWVKALDSTTWRRVAAGSTLGRLRRSAAFAAMDLRRRAMLSRFHAWYNAARYADVSTLCLLVGHTKSGGSLLGALLDAHPEVAFADEVDALAYLSGGFAPEQVYYLLEKGARREAMKGKVTARRLEPYALAVPGQWQGRAACLRVVGDSRAGIATQRLGADVGLLANVQDRLGAVDLRLLHVVRNPFDPMSAMMLRGRRTFDSALERYFANCAILADLHARLPAAMIRLVRYEELVADPAGVLSSVCKFLDLDVDGRYLRDCASIVVERVPEHTRVTWNDHMIERVEREIARYTFLDGYAFARKGDRA